MSKQIRMLIKNPLSKIIEIIVVLSLFFFTFILFFKTPNKEYPPRTNDGKKWRIGYYEGGSYQDYQLYLIALINGLERIKWIPEVDIPDLSSNNDTKKLWKYLTTIESEYIEFVEEAYWSSSWYEDQREVNKLDVTVYLQQEKLDLIIGGGTWGGLDLANNLHRVPVVVISTSDPIGAGIIKSAKDSGYHHVHATCDPDRYVRQIIAFHNIIGFKRLGIVFENTGDGRVYASIDDALKASLIADFRVITCIAFDQNLTEEESMKGVYKCHEQLATKVDAIYIGAHRGTNSKWMPNVLKPLFDNNIPTFAQEGPDQVRRGVLLSIARVETEDMGDFYAETIAKIFNGISPREINQVFEQKKRIVINMETARRIGLKIPESICATSLRSSTNLSLQLLPSASSGQ